MISYYQELTYYIFDVVIYKRMKTKKIIYQEILDLHIKGYVIFELKWLKKYHEKNQKLNWSTDNVYYLKKTIDTRRNIEFIYIF